MEINNNLTINSLEDAVADFFSSPQFKQILEEKIAGAVEEATKNLAADIQGLKEVCTQLAHEVAALKMEIRSNPATEHGSYPFGSRSKQASVEGSLPPSVISNGPIQAFRPSQKSQAASSNSQTVTTLANKKKKAFINPWAESLEQIFWRCLLAGILNPVKMFKLPQSEDKDNFYCYHVIPGHKTNECFGLYYEIKRLIQEEQIKEPTPVGLVPQPGPLLAASGSMVGEEKLKCLLKEIKDEEELLGLV